MRPGQTGLFIFTIIWFFLILPIGAMAAPYAGMVMDARSGKVYYSENADTRLHPASLTKMMTLYIAFEAVEHGELTMDTLVTVSRNAAAEPPSKLGLRSGQKIALRYLVRAAAVKSANDAATAIGEAISGSEAAFARRMNRTAKALGMTRTTFKNAHGLTESGHLSTARDMSILGRHVLYDYPEYYNLFSRITADAGVREVYHTNRRLLQSYSGADGIKTGYTNAAGFNLVASAERGGERVIATVFGGKSTASRNAQVAKLLDLGFSKAPSRVAFASPGRPVYQGNAGLSVTVERDADPTLGHQGRAVRTVAAAVTRSLRPMPRPGSAAVEPAPLVASVAVDIESVIAEAEAESAAEAETVALASVEAESSAVADAVAAAVDVAASTIAPGASVKPRMRPAAPQATVTLASAGPPKAAVQSAARRAEEDAGAEVVTRVSTSGGRHWGVNIGRFPSQYAAETKLVETALAEMSTLDGTLRKVVHRPTGFDANFMGMTREMADLACRRLQARNVTCFMVGPS
ncbi:D-alanyl-D-alanine carboxypeptidase [Roseivivax marinus]|jgi:D-alanyl-D-alanine carboxypeptidase|uniref:D-alanyl-D-alanine carboxypeptidase family protein n=1 Tax=Roseivivax marinus TaxID=1379903 RepID=UPI0008C69EF8|nr:D-alanyl-D-alanine carboxypeptidase family protein [Roseivivax marinus]SEK29642.1 D-alanyl-D-alanine carboxypeptidase [Roseivivax marinus]